VISAQTGRRERKNNPAGQDGRRVEKKKHGVIFFYSHYQSSHIPLSLYHIKEKSMVFQTNSSKPFQIHLDGSVSFTTIPIILAIERSLLYTFKF